MRKSLLLSFILPIAGFAFGMVSTQAHAGSYLITIQKAKISAKKSKYRRWDTGFGQMPKPDAYVIMEVAGQRFQTPVQKNTFTPKWNTSWKLTLKGTERLYFVVYDKDLGSDDLIGKGSIQMKDAKAGKIAFGKVLSFSVTVERLDKPKPAIRKAAPAVRKAAPAVRKAAPVVRKAAPVVRKAAPAAVRKAAPVVRKAAPVVRKAAPVVRKAAPVVRKAAPVVRKAAPAVRKAAPVVRKAAPAVRKAAPASRPAAKKVAPTSKKTK